MRNGLSMKQKVIVGMSGGVDSSVAAFLLLEQGYEVEGLFMKNWEGDDNEEYCAAEEDLADAKAVATKLSIPLHSVNFARQYWDKVFEHFLSEYRAGRTPNPDILCNKEIKFNAFLEYAMDLGADFIATGHYVQKSTHMGQSILIKGKDREKDQTYFLYAISQHAIEKSLFPVGQLLKEQVRQIALEQGFANHDKKDSTGICFIGERKFKAFLSEYLLAQPGNIESSQGDVIGRHDGLMYYTMGQRQGLKIGGLKHADDAPWYVVDKDAERNALIVAQGSQHPMLYANGLICSEIHWLIAETELPLQCNAKTRYRQPCQGCIISPVQQEGHCVMFSNPQRAITAGQSIVFYNQNQCIGGAIIEKVIR
jgi:tRNA-uridine 2-sulfurtransferase